jgi:hypothetical protein
VRKKLKAVPPEMPAPPVPSEREEQAAALKSLLAEVGARRSVLASRLGAEGVPLSDAALQARFRAAGLERELSLRERDLLRALWTKHRAAEERVARELQTTPLGLRRIALETGLSRELDRMRDKFRHEAREKKWPRDRIHQVLYGRDELRDLGLLEELDKEVSVRVRVLWTEMRRKPDALSLLAKVLRLTPRDVESLQLLLKLR